MPPMISGLAKKCKVADFATLQNRYKVERWVAGFATLDFDDQTGKKSGGRLCHLKHDSRQVMENGPKAIRKNAISIEKLIAYRYKEIQKDRSVESEWQQKTEQ